MICSKTSSFLESSLVAHIAWWVRWVLYWKSASLSLSLPHTHHLVWTIHQILNSKGKCKWETVHGAQSLSHPTCIIHSLSPRWPRTFISCVCINQLFVLQFLILRACFTFSRELSTRDIYVSRATMRLWCFGVWLRGTSVMLSSYWQERQHFLILSMDCLTGLRNLNPDGRTMNLLSSAEKWGEFERQIWM